MRQPHSAPLFRKPARLLLACAIAGTIAASLTLPACESALSNDSYSSARGVDMMVAKAAYQGTYTGDDMVQSPTIPGGVREIARVDSPGPTPGTDNAAIPPGPIDPNTTIPTSNAPVPASKSNPIETSANNVGLEAATLNQREVIFNLTLQDAIARTMKNALSIKVEAYNPAIKEALLVQAEAAFDPVLFGASQWNDTHEPQIQQGSITNGETFQNQLGIRKLLPTGGTVQVSAGDTYRIIPHSAKILGTGAGVAPGDSYTGNLNLTLSQPLLRGFGAKVSQATIYADRRDYRIALNTFRRQVITTVANVEEAYHNLVLARTTVDIDEQLLAATIDTERRVWDRQQIDADKVSVNQAIAAVQLRRAELVLARQNLRDTSDKLKNLINDPEISIRENALINPIDKPIADPIVVSTREAIETALHQRTELQEGRLNIEKSDIAIDVAKNDLLPKLDLTVSVQNNSLEDNFGHASADTVNQGDYLDYSAAFKLEVPLGNRFAESELKQRQRERQQLLTELVEAAQSVVLDVKLQLRNVMSRYQEIQAREMARKSAEDELRAIIDKESIVNLTPEFLQLKLDSQNRLASAEQSLIEAIVNYNIAIMRLEQAKGTLLEFDRISLDRPPVNNEEPNTFRFIGQSFNFGK